MKSHVIQIAALSLMSFAAGAQDTFVNDELFRQLRRQPALATVIDGHRVQVVNDRYEPCSHKKEARFLLVSTPVGAGHVVHVFGPDGTLLMEGHSLDPVAVVPDGVFRYYHGNGVASAVGRYVNGLKVGVWHRFDRQGGSLPDKEYDGLGWEEKQVKLGLVTEVRITGNQDDGATDRGPLRSSGMMMAGQ